ncbi:MAG: citrate synthase [Chloroflexota bacterium]
MTTPDVIPGLEGVIAAETGLSSVDGLKGELIIAGFPLAELAENATFEEAAYLLWHGKLPDGAQLETFHDELAQRRALPQITLQLLDAAAAQQTAPMDALRMVAATLDLDLDDDPDTQALSLLARLPTAVAAYHRLRQGRKPLSPREELSHAANYLYLLHGEAPTPAQVRALDTYLITVVDHGLNASTFTARTIVSTDSDLVSAITGAIGALKGPKHGGAPGPALDMVFEIGHPDHAEPTLRAKLERGERLMGFGHRVYKVRDPRADVLSRAAARLYESSGQQELIELYDLARHVEQTAVRLLEEFKPGRNLQTNVEFYTALLLHGLNLSSDLFSPTFAIGRLPGWIAHCLEQQRNGRLIRPDSVYTGRRDRRWQPLPER